MTLSSQDASFADHLIYLTGIPNDASEQEVTDLVGSFGKINNVILMPCTKEENARGEGQKVWAKCKMMVICKKSSLWDLLYVKALTEIIIIENKLVGVGLVMVCVLRDCHVFLLSFICTLSPSLLLGICMHGEGWRCSSSGKLQKSIHQRSANNCFSSQGTVVKTYILYYNSYRHILFHVVMKKTKASSKKIKMLLEWFYNIDNLVHTFTFFFVVVLFCFMCFRNLKQSRLLMLTTGLSQYSTSSEFSSWKLHSFILIKIFFFILSIYSHWLKL